MRPGILPMRINCGLSITATTSMWLSLNTAMLTVSR